MEVDKVADEVADMEKIVKEEIFVKEMRIVKEVKRSNGS